MKFHFIPRKSTRLIYSLSLLIVFVSFFTLFIIKYPDKVYNVGVIVSSGTDKDERVDSIKFFIGKKINQFNKNGGISGIPIRAIYMDDFEESELTIKNVENAIADESLLGIIGCWNSTRGEKIVNIIGKSSIPFIADFSVDTIFSSKNNIFSMGKGISDELSVFDIFMKSKSVRKVAFIGRDGDLYTMEYYGRIKDNSLNSGYSVVYDAWFLESEKMDNSKLMNIVSGIRESSPDMIFLSLGSSRNAEIVKTLSENDIKVPVYFILGTMGKVISTVGYKFDFDWYDTAEEGVPNVESQRLEELIDKYNEDILRIGLKH
uniref:Substrate-binding protein n=1 Tax=Candidatus Kentrum sp. LPFa TaxID=2126335 RepID=A0A450WFU4_9GAMM|nr:MAG: substrate-binding protein [Candidatus Kentron sp. LPFa]VFK31324.1 MAG: substrate-binding protein [Candidatus Kentron sp. LPFa]